MSSFGPGQAHASGLAASAVGPVQAAYDLLDMERPAECLKVLEAAPAAGPLAMSILAVARGMLAQDAGQHGIADAAFEQAARLGLPLQVLLRQRGRHHLVRGQTAEAFECFSLLECLRPGSFFPFWQELDLARKSRYAPWVVSRLLHARPPRIYPLQQVKAALVERLGIAGAAATYAPLYRPGQPWTLLERRLGSLMDYARGQALAYEVLLEPRDVLMSAPALFGGRRLPGIAGRTRTVFFCVLPDMVVASKSNLLLARDQVLMDYQGDELSRAEINLDADPVILAGSPDRLQVLDQPESARRPPLDEAFSLVGIHTWNFGHWIVEFMFQVWLCMGRPGFGSVPLVIDEQMPSQLREMLELFVGADHPVVVLKPGETVRVAKLWCCSRIAYWPGGVRPGTPVALDVWLSDAERLCNLIRSLEPRLDEAAAGAAGGKRLYLRRKDSQRRRMVNRIEVEQWFSARGFELVDFDDLTFAEQLRRVRSADFIVGPDGATFYGLLFARPGTRIGMLAQPALEGNEWWNEMFRQLGLPFLLYVGSLHALNPDYPSQSEVRIDTSGLEAFLAELGEMGPRSGDTGPAIPPLRIPPIVFDGSFVPANDGRELARPLTSDEYAVDRAQACLASGSYARAREILAASGEAGELPALATGLLADAALALARGERSAARRCVDQAFELGLPAAALLHQCGKHLLQLGVQDARAYECFATLAQLEPEAFDEFSDALPPAHLARLAPAVLSNAARRSSTTPDRVRTVRAALVGTFGATVAEMVLAECHVPAPPAAA
jgi:tetratricopeptide (TPR) repeat protein